MKNLYSIDVQGEIMTVKFTILDDGKLVPKEWVLKTASDKLANFWKQLMEYELKMRNKSPPPKKTGNSSVAKDKQAQSGSQENLSAERIQNNSKRNETSSPSKPVPPKEETGQKKSIELKPSAKVF